MALIRILSWNILQGGGSRTNQILEAIERHHPDILALQEYRENLDFVDALHHQGLTSFFAPEASSSVQNRPAIAARWPFESTTFPIDRIEQTRVVSAQFQAPDAPFDLEIFNLHLPHKKEQIPVFDHLLDLDGDYLSKPSIMIGDFNCGIPFEDSETKSFDHTLKFQQLLRQGWIDAWRQRNRETKEFSWISSKKQNGYRYDNALVTELINHSIKEINYDHQVRIEKASDHSAMYLDIKV